MSTTSNTIPSKDAPVTKVAEHATEHAKLALNKPMLLGTFGSAEKLGALIRMPSGDTVKVTEGESTRIGSIEGIADGEVIITQNGSTTRLSMPR